ncbi:serine/threonine-protein kinase [Cypionkella sp. TWP1-2-1b2]|uniref:serine/threonine-protein kinase n=1 Tax=Cypionkella sp. TWP1-2-1b2 TaxID=2804675 RepID=UPI003CEA40B1
MSDTPNSGPNHATTVSSGTLIMGTYEIERLINSGGMGEVYRGRNIHNDEPVAIKIVLPSLAHDPKIVALFQKESTTLSRLSHEAIVRYHVFTVDPTIGRPCMVMEFVSGTSMSDRIEQGPMPVDDVRVMLRRVASGLDKAHRAGVVHRDLSPDNVILEDGHVEHAKLIDFGIAKSTALGAGTLLQGQFAGKFNWVSPEQLGAFGGTVDGRSDIYSLALVTAAASKGEVLPMGASIVDAVGKRSAVPDLNGVDEALVPLLSWMLQPDPALRPDSMAKVMAAVDNPALVPQIAAPAPKAPDPNRTVIGGALPIQQPKVVSVAPVEPSVSVAPVSVAPVVNTSAPVAATVIAAVTQAPESEDVSPFGAPGMAAAVKPTLAEPLVVKNSKSGLIAVVALLALGGGAAAAYFGGVFDGKVVPVAGETQADAETRVKAETADAERAAAEAKAAADAAAAKAAENAAAIKAAADVKTTEDAAKQAEADAAARKAADELAAQKAADEAAAKLAADQAAARKAADAAAAQKAVEEVAAQQTAAQKAEADAAAKQAADEAATKQAADAAAAQKLAEEAAAQKAADEAAAKQAAEAQRLADEAAAKQAADEAAAKKAADEAAAKQAAEAEVAAAEAAAQKAAEEAAAAQQLADEAAAKKAAEEAAAKADPVAAQLAYLAGVKPPLCAMVTLKDAKAAGFGLDGYAADAAALASFAKDWQVATQTTPDLAVHAINAAQCPLIEFASHYPAPDVDPLAVVMQTPGEVVKSGANVSGKVEGLEGRNFALFIFSEGGGATNLKPWTTMGSDGTANFEFNLTLEANAPPAPQILLAMVTDKPLPALDKVPAGVTAQSLMPFLEKQLEKAGVKPTLSFAYFRLEN